MLEILLDAQDAHLWALAWYVTNGSYLRRNYWEDGRRRYEFLHRLIAGAREGEVVDHINGNPLDNRRCNLRVCTVAENTLNRRTHSNNQLGVKGVYIDRTRYRAQIRVDGRKFHLGSFASLREAKAAYDVAAQQLHGQFARLS